MIVTDNKLKHCSELIVQMAKRSYENLPYWKTWQRELDPDQFVYEFQTIRIMMPRQTGHTIAALQLMYEYPNSLMIVPEGQMREYVRNMMRNYIEDPDVIERIEHNLIVPSRRAIVDIKAKKHRPFIIFDQASRISKHSIELVKETANADIYIELQ